LSLQIGLTLEDRIRQSLEPLGEKLRIDSFVAVMEKERKRMESQKNMIPKEMDGEAGNAEQRVQAAVDPPAKENVVASLQDEVEAFMHRDNVEGADANEVSEYMELAGRGFDNSPDDKQ
jgi:hypothetical protein